MQVEGRGKSALEPPSPNSSPPPQQLPELWFCAVFGGPTSNFFERSTNYLGYRLYP